MTPPRPPRGRRLRRWLRWHRRSVGAALAALAVVLTVLAALPSQPSGVAVWVAARDITGGTTLRSGDLRPAVLAPASVPDGAVTPGTRLEGRTVAAPMRRGEAVTDVRLVGPALVATSEPGSVAAPVRLADAGAAGLLRAGDLVDVLAAEPSAELGGAAAPSKGSIHGDAAVARTVVTGARVLVPVQPAAGDPLLGTGAGADGGGALVVLAVSRQSAAQLAQAAATARLSVILRAG